MLFETNTTGLRLAHQRDGSNGEVVWRWKCGSRPAPCAFTNPVRAALAAACRPQQKGSFERMYYAMVNPVRPVGLRRSCQGRRFRRCSAGTPTNKDESDR